MKTIFLAAGAVAVALSAGSALSAPRKSSPAMSGPSQPIPYPQLDAYLKASPKQRASQDWWSGSAATGASPEASATVSEGSTAGKKKKSHSTSHSATKPSESSSGAVNPDRGASPPSTSPPTDNPPQGAVNPDGASSGTTPNGPPPQS